MSRNNTFYTKAISNSLFESIDGFIEIWDFLEEAFDEFEEVSFLRDVENFSLYVYFDTDKKTYMKVIPYVQSGSITGLQMLFYLNEIESTNKVSAIGSNVYIRYIRTKYGITWSMDTSQNGTETSWNPPLIYTPAPVPTIWVGLSTSGNSTYAIISPLHETIEIMKETSTYISTNLGGQKFIMTTAYSCLEDINAQHVFRVLGYYSNAPGGRIKVGDKYVFWVGKYALEYDPDDTTGV